MSTHSKKKFVGNVKVDWKMGDLQGVEENAKSSNEIDFEVYNKAFMQLEDKTIIQGFVHKTNKGNYVVIPEPEPSILYFTNAEGKLKQIVALQAKVMNSTAGLISNDLSHSFYSFFQLASDYVINLFNSLEAFNNSLIPDDFDIKIKGKNYNKIRVQRSLDFLTKTKKVVPQITNKSFVKQYGHKYEFLLELKSLRDNVVHFKNLSSGFPASYRDLYVNYLEFDFVKSYDVIKDYMNFYKKDWIEVCNCGK